MTEIRVAFERYFEKLVGAWQSQFGTKPRIPFELDMDQELLLGEPGNDNLIEWLPVKVQAEDGRLKLKNPDVSIAVTEYFDSYRFLSAGGHIDDLGIQLFPVTESSLKNELPTLIESYRNVHFGDLRFVPIGVEVQTGDLVLMENSEEGSRVFLGNEQTATIQQIAGSIVELLARLSP
jgi:hypothetical protein